MALLSTLQLFPGTYKRAFLKRQVSSFIMAACMLSLSLSLSVQTSLVTSTLCQTPNNSWPGHTTCQAPRIQFACHVPPQSASTPLPDHQEQLAELLTSPPARKLLDTFLFSLSHLPVPSPSKKIKIKEHSFSTIPLGVCSDSCSIESLQWWRM